MGGSAESIYLDRPLSNARDIRVLDVTSTPCDLQNPVQCTLRVISIDSPLEKYQTLSYAWGSAARTHTILCGGESLRVTQNLDEALRRIREKIFLQDVFSSTIWIDDICINQDDNSEKSKQVAMMGDIYHRSSRLVIWLGEASKLEINSIQAAIENPEDATSPAILQRLTSLPWFERLWVVQEVFRSRRACRHVLLGGFRCRFDRVIMSCADAKVLTSSTALLRAWLPEMTRSNSALISDFTKSTNPPLVENMVRFRETKASLLQDRAFAMLSISASGTEVPVDYEADFRTVCIELGSKHVMSNMRLACLLMYATALRLEHNVAPDLPSWVPDWRATATILESDPQKLQKLESEIPTDSAGRSKVPAVPHQRKIEQNVLIVDTFLFGGKIFGEYKSLPACDGCRWINNAVITNWLARKGWVRDLECGRLIVFQLVGNSMGVVFIATVIGDEQEDALNVVLNSYHIWPAAHGDGHHWHTHRHQQQMVHIH